MSTIKLAEFKAPDVDQQECVKIIEDALANAKAGKIVDVAIITAERTENGPIMRFQYYGQGSWATLVTGVTICMHTMMADWRDMRKDL